MKSSTISAFAAVIGGLGLIVGLMVPTVMRLGGIELMLMIWAASGAIALSLAICASIVKHLERLTRAAEILIGATDLPCATDGTCPRCGARHFRGSRCNACGQRIRVETDE